MYKLLLSLRYFRSRFLAVASLLAITFGVAMLVIVLSVMGGYLVQLQENIRGQEAHLQILSRFDGVRFVPELDEAILAVPNVRAAAPFVERLAVYQTGLSFQPCQLEGIDPLRQMAVGDFDRFTLRPEELGDILARFAPRALTPGEAAAPETPDVTMATRAVNELVHSPARAPLSAEELTHLFSRERRREVLDASILELIGDDLPPAGLVGIQLLLDGRVYLGEIVTVLTVNPDPSNPEPLHRDFVITGAVKTGDFEEDSNTIYAHLGIVKNFLPLLADPDKGIFRYDGVRVAIEDPERLEETRASLEAALEHRFRGLVVVTWRDLRSNFLRAVLIETALVYLIVLILVVFTGSMILLMLLLTVIEKTRDVGILMSLGATPQGITGIFLFNGFLICSAGTVLGLLLGLAFCTYINDIHDFIYDLTGWSLFSAEIYRMDRIPVAFKPLSILLSAVPPVVIGLLASLVPALWAPRRDPIRSIQYE